MNVVVVLWKRREKWSSSDDIDWAHCKGVMASEALSQP